LVTIQVKMACESLSPSTRMGAVTSRSDDGAPGVELGSVTVFYHVASTVLLGPRCRQLLAALPGLVGDPHRPLELAADLDQAVAARRFGILEALLAQRQQDPEPGMRTVEDLRRMLPPGGLGELVESAVEGGPGPGPLAAEAVRERLRQGVDLVEDGVERQLRPVDGETDPGTLRLRKSSRRPAKSRL
jgi:hypothetical protein